MLLSDHLLSGGNFILDECKWLQQLLSSEVKTVRVIIIISSVDQ